ncbi:MAG TPA: alpha/beta fold hydrolase [Kribbellaceae bacterium]
MYTTTSADGTRIAYEQAGSGAPVVFVTGAFNDRTTCAPLAKLLEDRFTVVTYDRRGKGDSGDTAPYAVEREIEDLAAVIAAVDGGPANVFGFSSGAVLALKAAVAGAAIRSLALYEAPYRVGADVATADMPDRLAGLVAAGRRGDAVELFQTEVVGLPAELVAGLRNAPFRPALEAMAPTLAYETTITGPAAPTAAELAAVAVPAVVLNGAKAWGPMEEWAIALAGALPHGRHVRLSGGENHDIDPEATAPVIGKHFAA